MVHNPNFFSVVADHFLCPWRCELWCLCIICMPIWTYYFLSHTRAGSYKTSVYLDAWLYAALYWSLLSEYY